MKIFFYNLVIWETIYTTFIIGKHNDVNAMSFYKLGRFAWIKYKTDSNSLGVNIKPKFVLKEMF